MGQGHSNDGASTGRVKRVRPGAGILLAWLLVTGLGSRAAETSRLVGVKPSIRTNSIVLAGFTNAPASGIEKSGGNEAMALAPGLSLETRRYLLYLYARINNAHMAEALAERILKDNPGDKQTLLVLASMYVERKDAEKALRNAHILTHYFPKDHQALYFLGASYYLAGQYTKANDVLKRLRLEQFSGQLYPYENDLASSALQAGDWYKAMLAYQELLRHHQLSEELRMKDREILERIYREHLPQMEVEQQSFYLNDGLIYRSSLKHRQHVTDSQRLLLEYSRRDVKLDERPGLQALWSDSNDTMAGWESTFSRRWRTEIWGGGTETGGRMRALARRSFGDQRWAEWQVDLNQRSEDGLLLEALDGRQHRISASLSYQLTRSWLAQATLYGREVVLDGKSLGSSAGGTVRLEHTFTHDIPDFKVGYHITWMTFSSEAEDVSLIDRAVAPGTALNLRQDILHGLVLKELHRHGVYAEYRDQISGALYYHGTAGIDYDLTRASLEYFGTAGFSFFPRKSIELRSEAGYNSSARTTDAASDVWQFTVAVKYWF